MTATGLAAAGARQHARVREQLTRSTQTLQATSLKAWRTSFGHSGHCIADSNLASAEDGSIPAKEDIVSPGLVLLSIAQCLAAPAGYNESNRSGCR